MGVNKVLKRIFNLKNLIIVSCLIFVVSMLYMKISSENRLRQYKDNIKNNLDEVKNNASSIEQIDSGDNSSSRYSSDEWKDIRILNTVPELCADKDKVVGIEKAFETGELNTEDIQGIMIGADIDGNGIERYYFTDKAIIKKVYEKLQTVKLNKMVSGGITTGYHVEPDWDIQFCRTDSEYAFRIYGEKTNYDNCYITLVDEVFNEGYYTPKNQLVSSYIEVFGSERQVLFDVDMVSFLHDIIKENINEIDMDTALELCVKDELDLAKLFGYKHTPPTYTVDLVYNLGRALIYEFPIKGTEYKLLILREAFTGNGLPETDVQRFELYNGKGEFIDILTASDEEVRSFVAN